MPRIIARRVACLLPNYFGRMLLLDLLVLLFPFTVNADFFGTMQVNDSTGGAVAAVSLNNGNLDPLPAFGTKSNGPADVSSGLAQGAANPLGLMQVGTSILSAAQSTAPGLLAAGVITFDEDLILTSTSLSLGDPVLLTFGIVTGGSSLLGAVSGASVSDAQYGFSASVLSNVFDLPVPQINAWFDADYGSIAPAFTSHFGGVFVETSVFSPQAFTMELLVPYGLPVSVELEISARITGRARSLMGPGGSIQSGQLSQGASTNMVFGMTAEAFVTGDALVAAALIGDVGFLPTSLGTAFPDLTNVNAMFLTENQLLVSATIPLPGGFLLMLTGLAGLIVARTRHAR